MKLVQLAALFFGAAAVWFLAAGLAALTLHQWSPGVWGCCVGAVCFQAHRSYNAQWRAMRNG